MREEPESLAFISGFYAGQLTLERAKILLGRINTLTSIPIAARIIDPILMVIGAIIQFLEGFVVGFSKPLLKDPQMLQFAIQGVNGMLRLVQALLETLIMQKQ
jgi:hypothetical protein